MDVVNNFKETFATVTHNIRNWNSLTLNKPIDAKVAEQEIEYLKDILNYHFRERLQDEENDETEDPATLQAFKGFTWRLQPNMAQAKMVRQKYRLLNACLRNQYRNFMRVASFLSNRRSGYWADDETLQYLNYDTYEEYFNAIVQKSEKFIKCAKENGLLSPNFDTSAFKKYYMYKSKEWKNQERE